MRRLRVTGNPRQTISRIGTMVGGLGLDRHLISWERLMMGLDTEVIIASGVKNSVMLRRSLTSCPDLT